MGNKWVKRQKVLAARQAKHAEIVKDLKYANAYIRPGSNKK